MAAESTADDRVAGPGTRRHRGLLIALGALLFLVLVVVAVTSVTPWPSAMLIRSVFERGGAATAAEMEKHVPENASLREETDITYADDQTGLTLDMYTTAAEGEALPTVVWIHGGAWISGSSADVDPYMRILADAGYTAIAVNYTLGPEAAYPTAVDELNDAFAYIDENAAELSVDPNTIVIAGDSAGGQLASQMATLSTNPDYAELMDLRPALDADQIAGVILNCGVYDLRAMADLNGLVAWGFKISLWSYTGTKDWSAESSGSTMATIQFVTSDFPPTYISGGNGDGLTWLQSIPMAQRLKSLDVPVTDVFWPADHVPALPHEYQFHLDLDEAQEALGHTLEFLESVTS
ncbi:alpha/beta hydrolase [Microbacterium sp. HD4P20]|uniref:alpha/beta hydrolase n=1 Tax=Microbacterium sp. HD4P20 TaxID=2864874 RepID=UPI001C63DAD4|nr:alpha/beta hydrolase [Microbacterium sp. HD4P20]MCP2636302.1 alpha/beta hydrolase [Microbacterium sp. HD4P20]